MSTITLQGLLSNTVKQDKMPQAKPPCHSHHDLAWFRKYFLGCLLLASQRNHSNDVQCTLHKLPIEVRLMIFRYVLDMPRPGCCTAWAKYMPQLNNIVKAFPSLQPDMRMCLMPHMKELSLRVGGETSEDSQSSAKVDLSDLLESFLDRNKTKCLCYTCLMRFFYSVATLLECGAMPADFVDCRQADGGSICKALSQLSDGAGTSWMRSMQPLRAR